MRVREKKSRLTRVALAMMVYIHSLVRACLKYSALQIRFMNITPWLMDLRERLWMLEGAYFGF